MRISPLALLVAFLVMNGLMANRALAQGTVVFVTSILGATAKVFEAATFPGAGAAVGNTVAGTEPGSHYLAQLFVAAGNVTTSASLVPVGMPVNFRGGTSNSGYVQESGTTSLGWPVDTTITIPASILPTPGGGVTIQLRAWWAGTNGNTYASWNAAVTSNEIKTRFGASQLIYLSSTGNPASVPPSYPALLTNLSWFQLNGFHISRPFIVAMPQSQTVPLGNHATFNVTVGGTGPLYYQWRKGIDPIPNATNPTLTISNVTSADAGSYDVVATNFAGQVTSNPVDLTVYLLGLSAIHLHSNPPSVPPGLYPGITINGLTGQTYTIQRKTNLAPSVAWVTVTNLTLTQPTHVWLDTSSDVHAPDAKTGFYRMLTP